MKVDYVLFRRGNLRDIGDCNIVAGENRTVLDSGVWNNCYSEKEEMSTQSEKKMKRWKLRKNVVRCSERSC